MIAEEFSKRKLCSATVGFLLVLQLLLFGLSVDTYFEISLFCTVGSGLAGMILGLAHFAFAILFIFGFLALFAAELRVPYILAIALTLCALPVQAVLVHNGLLTCDAL